MPKAVFIFLIVFVLKANAQIYTDCFLAAKEQAELNLQNSYTKPGDTLKLYSKQIGQMLIGCKFPFAPTKTYNDNEINPSTIKADYVVINFNSDYCDICTGQLEYLVKLKKESSVTIDIISFFSKKTSDVQNSIDKYKNNVYFVTNADKWIKDYNLNLGYPLNFVLDKNKLITYAESGGSADFLKFYEGLKKSIK